MSNPFEIKIEVSDPYLRADGKLCIKIILDEEIIEREIDGTKYTKDGERWKLIDPDGE